MKTKSSGNARLKNNYSRHWINKKGKGKRKLCRQDWQNERIRIKIQIIKINEKELLKSGVNISKISH